MNTAWVQISAGQGPAECCWAVAQLLAVLRREAEAAGLAAELIDSADGEQPGTLRSALLRVEGKGGEEFLRSWRGTIQWVGKSPYRPNHKRKNWFVGVEAFAPPEVPSWSEDELRVETMRCSGPGGQHVNKTSSAVRITHVPTGTSVVAREERSQHRNRRLALARLAEAFAGRASAAEGDARQARWSQHQALERGNAIRVFVGPGFEEE